MDGLIMKYQSSQNSRISTKTYFELLTRPNSYIKSTLLSSIA